MLNSEVNQPYRQCVVYAPAGKFTLAVAMIAVSALCSLVALSGAL